MGACWVPLTRFTDEQTEVWLAWGLRAEKLLKLELPHLLGPPASPTGGYFTSPDTRGKHRASSRERPWPSALPCLWDLPQRLRGIPVPWGSRLGSRPRRSVPNTGRAWGSVPRGGWVVPCGVICGWWPLAWPPGNPEALHERFGTFLHFDHFVNLTLIYFSVFNIPANPSHFQLSLFSLHLKSINSF